MFALLMFYKKYQQLPLETVACDQSISSAFLQACLLAHAFLRVLRGCAFALTSRRSHFTGTLRKGRLLFVKVLRIVRNSFIIELKPVPSMSYDSRNISGGD